MYSLGLWNYMCVLQCSCAVYSFYCSIKKQPTNDNEHIACCGNGSYKGVQICTVIIKLHFNTKVKKITEGTGCLIVITPVSHLGQTHDNVVSKVLFTLYTIQGIVCNCMSFTFFSHFFAGWNDPILKWFKLKLLQISIESL